MYVRFGILGVGITLQITVSRDTTTTETTILGGSTHNFERFVEETTYEYEPEDTFGFR